MALSLNDLKKKKPTLPHRHAESKAIQESLSTPSNLSASRKKLSPWDNIDSIKKDLTLTQEVPLPPVVDETLKTPSPQILQANDEKSAQAQAQAPIPIPFPVPGPDVVLAVDVVPASLPIQASSSPHVSESLVVETTSTLHKEAATTIVPALPKPTDSRIIDSNVNQKMSLNNLEDVLLTEESSIFIESKTAATTVLETATVIPNPTPSVIATSGVDSTKSVAANVAADSTMSVSSDVSVQMDTQNINLFSKVDSSFKVPSSVNPVSEKIAPTAEPHIPFSANNNALIVDQPTSFEKNHSQEFIQVKKIENQKIDLNVHIPSTLQEQEPPIVSVDIFNPEHLVLDTTLISSTSDTEMTQKEHRSDTDLTQNSLLESALNSMNQTKEVTQKEHRSDTNINHKRDSEFIRSDTEVTHINASNISNFDYSKRSDTEVTQNSQSEDILKTLRSDTEVTQTIHQQTDLQTPINKNKNLFMKKRSDTEVTRSLKSSEFVSDLSKELTQIRHRSDTEVTPISTQKRHKEVTQISSVLDTSTYEKRILVLRGNQLAVFNFLCEALLNTGENILRSNYEAIALQTTVNIGSIKTTTKRLRDANLVEINSFGGGKGAPIEIYIPDLVLKIFARKFNNRSDTNVTQKPPEKRHRSDTIPDTNSPSKLVSKYNNNLLTSENRNQNIYEEEDVLDVSAIQLDELFKFHITRKQIQDIKNQKLDFTTATLQDFVDRFAIYAADPKNIRNVKSIPAVFVKMAQLASRGQDPLLDVETEIDRLIRERIDRLKAKQDERLLQETQLLELEYENWTNSLTFEQVERMVPPTNIMKTGSATQKIMLKNYFIEKLWPEKKKVLFNEAPIERHDLFDNI